MSFYIKYMKYGNFDFEKFFYKLRDRDIEKALNKECIDEMDYLALLSPVAEKYLEQMAVKAQQLTIRNFGKVIFLFTPLYLSNYCTNKCVYCGFNITNNIKRSKLTLDEVEQEAEAISRTGIRHILILTGESRKESPVSYIKECVHVLKNTFRQYQLKSIRLRRKNMLNLLGLG